MHRSMTEPSRVFAPAAFLLLLFLLGLGFSSVPARDTTPTARVLLSSGETVIGQEIAFPEGAAMITSVIITLPPGAETGWHRHDAPLFAYVLDGEITVDYGSDGRRTYTAGDAFLEAYSTDHKGMNAGSVPAKVLAVFAGAEGVQNTVPSAP